MDVAHWQPDAEQTPQLSPCPMMDRTGGHTHIKTHTHTHTQSWFIHNVVQKCSFGSSRNRADVMGHGLCTNYVWDSCERRGPCQLSRRLPSKRGRQAESIPQHQWARSVQNSSWACARNGLVVRKQHLWTKMDACLTLGSCLLRLPRLLNFPTIYLFTGKEILASWLPSGLTWIPHSPHGLNPAWNLCCRSSLFLSLTHSISCLSFFLCLNL